MTFSISIMTSVRWQLVDTCFGCDVLEWQPRINTVDKCFFYDSSQHYKTKRNADSNSRPRQFWIWRCRRMWVCAHFTALSPGMLEIKIETGSTVKVNTVGHIERVTLDEHSWGTGEIVHRERASRRFTTKGANRTIENNERQRTEFKWSWSASEDCIAWNSTECDYQAIQ